jgi:hypothetical protein
VASDDHLDEAEFHSHKEGLQVEIESQTRKTIERIPRNVTNLGEMVFLLTSLSGLSNSIQAVACSIPEDVKTSKTERSGSFCRRQTKGL